MGMVSPSHRYLDLMSRRDWCSSIKYVCGTTFE